MMKKYKIEFQDIFGNEIYSVQKEFNNLREAMKYAYNILANSNDDCIKYQIFELLL